MGHNSVGPARHSLTHTHNIRCVGVTHEWPARVVAPLSLSHAQGTRDVHLNTHEPMQNFVLHLAADDDEPNSAARFLYVLWAATATAGAASHNKSRELFCRCTKTGEGPGGSNNSRWLVASLYVSYLPGSGGRSSRRVGCIVSGSSSTVHWIHKQQVHQRQQQRERERTDSRLPLPPGWPPPVTVQLLNLSLVLSAPLAGATFSAETSELYRANCGTSAH